MGRIAEISGVITQGATRDECQDNLHSALEEWTEMMREEGRPVVPLKR